MAYTANIKRPQYNSNNNSGNNNQNSFDRLITVLDIDPVKKAIYAEDDTGKKYEVIVNAEEFAKQEAAIARKGTDTRAINWMGHNIDAKMKKNIASGSKLVLKKSKVIQRDNGEGYAKTEVHRVNGVPNPEPDKTYQTVVTMNYRMKDGKKVMSRVQDWKYQGEFKGIDINNEEGLAQLSAAIDESASFYGQKIGEFNIVKPTIGFQFRALVKTDRTYSVDGSPIFDAVDFSLPFSWIPGPTGEDGKEIKGQARPPSGNDMMEMLGGFADYISSKEHFSEMMNDMRIEVVPFYSFPAGMTDNMQLTSGIPEQDIHSDKNPLYQLAHAVSFIDMEQTEQLVGSNAAVKGIIQLSGNKLVKVNGRAEEIPNYWVNQIHANNVRGHVHAFIRTSDGFKVEPVEQLKLQRNEKKEQYLAEKSAPSAAPAAYSAPVAQTAPVQTYSAPPASVQPAMESADDEMFDPFSAPPAAAPAAAEAPESSEAPAVKKFSFGKKA